MVKDLEWPVVKATKPNKSMTPALLQQFRLFYAQDRPLGVVLWATVSPEVEKMLVEGTRMLTLVSDKTLRPQDWKSGDQAWVLPKASSEGVLEACFQHDEVIAPFGGAEEMVKDLKAKVFPTRELKYLDTKDGKREVKVA